MGSSHHFLQCALALCASLLLVKVFLKVRRSKSSRLPYPPGPKPLPVIGNAFNLPLKTPWKTYAQWGKQFGELIHFSSFGQHVVIVNSSKVANDLFEKRSHIYSDKPDVPMINLTGWKFVIGFMPYSDRWRKHRRYFNQMFRLNQVRKYHDIMRRKVHGFLRKMVDDPDNFLHHTRLWATDNIMSTVYGYDVTSDTDPFVYMADKAMAMLSNAVFPGTFLVNSLPFLQHLPDWLPGLRFKQYGKECHRLVTAMQEIPYESTKKRIERNGFYPCVASDLLERSAAQGKTDVDEDGVIKRVAGVAYAAGADTSASVMQTAILAMTLFPNAQRTAQAEIDSVVGNARLPDFGDRGSLTYTEAFFRECLRWQPVAPLALTHATTADDVYNGYFIPAGASVFGNAWAILHDEQKYEDPESFKPERYLLADGRLSDDFPISAFGFGRRICPGRYLAEDSIWLAMTAFLSVFDVRKAKDQAGNEIPVTVEYTDAMLSHPLPFKCEITPRSVSSLVVIQGGTTE